MKKFIAVCAVAASLVCNFASAETKKVVNVTYVPTPFNLQLMVMRDQGILDQELAKHGATVEWHKISSGVHQAKAMASGSVDIASVMNTNSFLMANREGNSLKVIGTVARPSKIFSLVVSPKFEGDIKDLADKKVAGVKGTVVQQMLVAQLAANDMTQSDVKFINMATPKAFNALMAGSIDAGLLTSSYILKAQDGGARVLATADGYINPILISATTDKFASENPQLVEAFLEAQRKAMNYIKTNHQQAIAIGATEHGVSNEQAEKLTDWSALASHFGQDDLQALKNDTKFLVENGLMRDGLDMESLVAPTSATYL
ncbi:ABC transporter substrate-binding protein [Vibrio europaeus]|uniref:ABC transporter substrate-binding protein n=1 Tax=Vibrio europaeus TaxID=300876 RepID=UPI0039DFEA69